MTQQQEDNRLFLLDAFALIYRAYFAFARNPLINSKGKNVSAISGFTSTLVDLMQREKPTHLAVVFDAPGPTDRAQEYEFYKANREAMPEDIREAIPYIKEIIKAFNIPILLLEGYEADDLIGTIAKTKAKEGHLVFMVSPDKDFCQLVDENIFLYKPGRQGKDFEVWGVEEVKQNWEVENPLQVIDILGMWGDAVDNIPGLPGVGEKTAKKLIKEYGSLEAVLDHAAEIPGKLGEKIAENKEQGIISKHLATIITDAPVSVSDDDLLISAPDKEKLATIFAELEFRTLGKRILGDNYSVNVKPKENAQLDLFGQPMETIEDFADEIPSGGANISNTVHNYILVDANTCDDLIVKLRSSKQFCFDTETTGLDPLIDELVGMSFSMGENEAYYVPIDSNFETAKKQVANFKAVLENNTITKIGQNIKYDILILRKYDIEVQGALFDTMVAHYLLEPDLKHNMDYLSETYLGYTPIHIEELIGKKGPKQLSMRDVALDKIKDYAAEDADITFKLYEKFEPRVEKRELNSLFHDLEMPLTYVLADMENEGVNLDVAFLKAYSEETATEILHLRTEIFREAGVEFNTDSPKQLGEVLFEKLKIPYEGKKTKTGQLSTNEETLQRLLHKHPIIEHILNYRELAKLKSTYIDALPNMVNPQTLRVHTTFNQTIAATGRLSSINPNLQNIPIRTERGRKIRQAFIPRNENYLILSADYSQIELRLIADIANEQAMLKDFENGLDIHAATAAKVYGIDMSEVSKTQRSNAKMVNFGIIYSISAFGLSQRLNIPRTEAKELIDNYFIQYPRIKNYMDETLEFARKKGYVKTILGRRRYLKDINSANFTVRAAAEREAINAPIQGSAADLIKVAMVNIQAEMKKLKMQSKMTLQVHDELVFDAHKNELDHLTAMVKDKMQNAIKLDVPIVVETGTGKNWLEAH